jgi:hypothetical protein
MTSNTLISRSVSDGIVKNLDAYALATRELLTDRNLTGEELRLLIFLMTHDLPDARNGGYRKGYVYLSRAYIASNFARCKRQISNLFSGLEIRGYVRREPRRGTVNIIHLAKSAPAEDVTLAENIQGSEPQPLQETCNAPLKEMCKGPLKKTFHQKNRIEDKKKKNRTTSDPNVKLLVDYFCSEYQTTYGHKYTVSGNRDGRTFKDLLKDHSVETLKRCIDLFLADTDPWLNGKRTIPVLRSRINQYIQEISGQSLGEKEEFPRIILDGREARAERFRRLAQRDEVQPQ